MSVSLWWRLKTGWVRKGEVLRKPSGIIGAMPRSKAAMSGSAWPSFAKTRQRATMSSRVVVSSSEMPSIVSPHSG